MIILFSVYFLPIFLKAIYLHMAFTLTVLVKLLDLLTVKSKTVASFYLSAYY